MLQCVCLGNNMGTEGMTYAGCQHVYDERKKQLTVRCFDHPTINNFTDAGLTALQKEFIPMQKAVETLWRAGAGHGAMYTQFFWTDADRYLKWCIWRDELYAGRVNRDGNARVMEDIFGPLDKLNREWKAWLDTRHHSFHFVDWGWEQSGNTLWSYGWPWNPANHSQTDLRYKPGEKVEYDPFRMDYPTEPMPPIVGPVKRGVREPSVGCVVDFSRNPTRGRAGMGLGLVSGDISPFAKERLFTDRKGRRQGVTVRAFKLGKVSGEGKRSADVSNGRTLGRSVDATIALGLEGSVTRGLKENFVVEWDGWLRVDETGEHTLSTASDDGSWLWIDGREVIDNGGQHGRRCVRADVHRDARGDRRRPPGRLGRRCRGVAQRRAHPREVRGPVLHVEAGPGAHASQCRSQQAPHEDHAGRRGMELLRPRRGYGRRSAPGSEVFARGPGEVVVRLSRCQRPESRVEAHSVPGPLRPETST